jgi:hypothetical protein
VCWPSAFRDFIGVKISRNPQKTKNQNMKKNITVLFVGALLGLGAVTSQAQTVPSITGTNGILYTLVGWVGSYNTNNAFGDFLGWDGPIYQNQVNVANEIGASYDLYRSAPAFSPSGLFFIAPEARFRQAGIVGVFVSEQGGIEGGWEKYDFRAGIALDGVHRENMLATRTGGGHAALEVLVFADKMFSSASGAGLFAGMDTGDNAHAPVIGVNLNLDFGNGSGFLGLIGVNNTAVAQVNTGRQLTMLWPDGDPTYK